MHQYSVADLFAGAGGLSKGFLLTGKYDVKAFVENNSAARETYLKNHSGAVPYSDVIGLDYSRLIKECGKIDVVVGGPPCQGFSNANRQHNELVNANNQLVKEYVRAVRELQPKAFVMENVKMLKSDVHVFFYTEEDEISGEIKRHGIKITDVIRDLLDEKYSSEKLYELCSSPSLLSSLKLSAKTFMVLNILRRQQKNPEKFKKAYLKYETEIQYATAELMSVDNTNIPESEAHDFRILSEKLKDYKSSFRNENMLPVLLKVFAVQHMIKDIEELRSKKIKFELISSRGIKAKIQSYSISEYIIKILSSPENNYTIAQGVLNAAEFGAPQKRQRFILIGIKDVKNFHAVTLPDGDFTEENFRTVRDAIGDLEGVPTHYSINESPVKIKRKSYRKGSLQALVCDSSEISNHTITDTREIALARFAALKQGENFHSLSDEMKINTYTDISRTQNSIYQRLSYDKPSGTVLNVRKSMWIHPVKDRALSIREAARLQTFPDSYVFCGTKDQQYQQIGNAVPPVLGMAIANHIADLLKKCADHQK